MRNDLPNYGFWHTIFAIGLLLFAAMIVFAVAGKPAHGAPSCSEPLFDALAAVPHDENRLVAALEKCQEGETIQIPRTETSYIATLCDAKRPMVADPRHMLIVCSFRGWRQ